MPSAAPNPNNYYAARQRRQSSQSQTSLPDQVRSSRQQVQSPNRSLAYLPSAAYSQPTPAPQRVSRPSADGDESMGDPDDFYRQYRDPFGETQPGGLHQTSLRTSTMEEAPSQTRRRLSSVTSTQSQDDRGLKTSRSSGSAQHLSLMTNTSGQRERSTSGSARALGSKKSSFRDLVARFDASPDDIPPLPSQPGSLAGSRRNSPLVYSNPHQLAVSSTARRTTGDFANNHKTVTQQLPAPRSAMATGSQQKRPLFGEVTPGETAASNLGYGIVSARRRRGSEGSPMHSPNPMFPDSMSHGSGRTYQAVSSSSQLAKDERPIHRRANSDAPSTPPMLDKYGHSHSQSAGDRTNNMHIIGGPSGVHSRQISASRIPVSTRRQSLTSDSNPSNSSSRAPSKLDNYPNSSFKTPAPRASLHPARGGKQSSPRRNAATPSKIRSPGRQGRSTGIPSSEKSPSLRANIIIPPPKVSPQLRSSRPRLPVSSASTAASRARMAEKFETLAKGQRDKQSSSGRSRPPELTDIDLKARRLRITQALSRSREGKDLRGDSSTSTAADRVSDASTIQNETQSRLQQARSDVPALTIENTEPGEDEFQTPVEDVSTHRMLAHNALSALEGRHYDSDDGDSPTLGQTSEAPALDMTFERAEGSGMHDTGVSDSAYAAVTDLRRPQEDNSQHDSPPALSLLTQVTSMREQNSASPRSRLSSQSDRQSDHADAESVNLILRNTTYLDEEEAVAKGYRDFIPPPPVPPIPEQYHAAGQNRESWTSSIAAQSDTTDPEAYDDEGEHDRTQTLADFGSSSPREEESYDPHHSMSRSDQGDDSVRNTMASDAYTIVNVVLQQNSSSGVVDQQLVDEIYGRLISEEPELANLQTADHSKIEELCLQELQHQNSRFEDSEDEEPGYALIQQNHVPSEDDQDDWNQEGEHNTDDDRPPPVLPKDDFQPPSFRAHRYKSSLDSAEDWANTSPSVGDWMQFATRSPDSENTKEPSPLGRGFEQQARSYDDPFASSTTSLMPQVPTHPPPFPPRKMPSIEQASMSSTATVQTVLKEPPQVPRRLASLSQMSSRSTSSQFPVPSLQGSAPESIAEDLSQEQKRLRQRRHVLKEIVDTEHSYERDLRVLCDIYMQTAAAALSEEDVKVLFGNVEAIQAFSKDFLSYLKRVVKPVYTMERSASRKDLTRTPTSTTDHSSMRSETPDLSDVEKDNRTKVGQAFQTSIEDMEKVYTEYIRSRHAANKKLEALQKDPAIREWLQECSNNSSDITNAWSLDALLVKPIQRITKYPLLLNQLLESTNEGHPDRSSLRQAMLEVTEINMRINEVKKQTELVDQVLNRRRKESDVRNNLTKAFGRRAEKLRQHVGISEVFEDGEYARLKMDFDNNDIHLMIVGKDCQGYTDALRNWVTKTCEMAAAAEAWLDVGHSNHPEAESKLRQLAMAVRGINSIALPDHVESVNKKVLSPMQKCLTMITRFKNDPKGLIQKREKKSLDYAQVKNRKDRGEKLDKKSLERMEQWEAINRETKARMRKLLAATATLVQSCLSNLVQLHMSWFNLVQQKFSAAMAIPLEKLDQIDLEKEWQVDFDFQEASALTLGICNGSLLAEAMNLVSFLTPGSTLNGEDSPRQSSWNSGAKRSISMNSDSSHPLPGDYLKRYSGGRSSSQNDYPGETASFGQNSARIRATSVASSKLPPRTPDLGGRGATLGNPYANGGNFSRPATSTGRMEDAPSFAPRVSLDTPSPSLGPLRTQSPAIRPGSASTFFSATAGPSNSAPPAATPGAGIFSSAMPMSDSPVTERGGPMPGGEEPFVLFTAASVYEFNIDRARQEAGIPYLTYVAGEIFDVIGERGELWLARNQDDPNRQVGWIWNKHFAKLAV